MISLTESYANSFERHRPRVLLFVILVTVLGGIAAWNLEFDDVPRDIFRSEDEGYARLMQTMQEFGSDDVDALVVLEADDWFTPERAGLLRELLAGVAEVEGVSSVFSPLQIPFFDGGLLPRSMMPAEDASADDWARAKQAALEHPLIGNQLLSLDGRTMIAVAKLDDDATAVREIRPTIEQLQDLLGAASEGGDVRARLSGIPTIRVEIYDVIKRENVRLFLLAGLFGATVAFVLLRRPGAIVPALAAAMLGSLWGVGAVQFWGGKIDILKTAMPSIVLVIGLTDGVHLVMDMRHGRAEGLDRVRAAGEAIRHLGPACFLTSVTTAIGFASLVVGEISIVKGFGIATATAVGFTFVAVLTTTPLFSSYSRHMGSPGVGITGAVSRLLRGVAEFVLDHTLKVSAVGVIGTGALLWLALQIEPDNRLTEASPRDRESLQALHDVDEAFGGSVFAGVVVEWDESLEPDSPEVLAAMDAVADAMRAAPHFSAPISLADLVRSLPGASASALSVVPDELVRFFVRPDLRKGLVRSRMPDVASAQEALAAERLEASLADIAEEHPRMRFALTGTTLVARDTVDTMIEQLARGLGLAAIVIFLVLALELRSLRLGLCSLVPNAFPIVFSAAFLHVSGHTLQVSTVVSFSVLLGIAVDDTVHLLVRYRRELAVDHDPRAAMARTIERVGAALFVTTSILLVGFGSLFLSEIPINIVTGKVCCIGFAAALVGDLLFLPALVVLLDERRLRARGTRAT